MGGGRGSIWWTRGRAGSPTSVHLVRHGEDRQVHHVGRDATRREVRDEKRTEERGARERSERSEHRSRQGTCPHGGHREPEGGMDDHAGRERDLATEVVEHARECRTDLDAQRDPPGESEHIDRPEDPRDEEERSVRTGAARSGVSQMAGHAENVARPTAQTFPCGPKA